MTARAGFQSLETGVNWRVTYRVNDGKRIVDVFEADDRDALFKVLASKGMAPIRIESADYDKSRTASRKTGSTASRIAAWGFAALMAALGVFVVSRLCASQDANRGNGREKRVSSLSTVPANKPVPAPASARRALTAEERRAGLEAVRKREYEGPALDMDTYVSPDPGFSNRWERFKVEQSKLPFKYMSENEIAAVLGTRPGEMVLDTMPHPHFERDFLESLEEAVVPLPTDDEKTAQLKRDMVQAKIILKEAYDNGESITDILREERAQLIKIHGLRENLFRELKSLEKAAQSPQEIDDFVSAANLMLDEYGAKHIKLPYSKERMRLERAEGLVQ